MSEPSFSPDKFDAQFQRILEATGCKTQVELADILEVRQSAISDAKRRMTIPSNWLETPKMNKWMKSLHFFFCMMRKQQTMSKSKRYTLPFRKEPKFKTLQIAAIKRLLARPWENNLRQNS